MRSRTDFLDGFLERNPVSATRIGDSRWDDQLSDYGDGGRAAQALAYTVGRREIEHARREVAGRMRDRFDLAKFHDEVLGHGTLPLTIIRREIPGWVEAAI